MNDFARDVAHRRSPVGTGSIVRIEDWAVVYCDEGKALVGRVYEHPRIADGHWTVTSLIVELRPSTAQTLNTAYELGCPLASPTPPHVSEALRVRGYALLC